MTRLHESPAREARPGETPKKTDGQTLGNPAENLKAKSGKQHPMDRWRRLMLALLWNWRSMR